MKTPKYLIENLDARATDPGRAIAYDARWYIGPGKHMALDVTRNPKFTDLMHMAGKWDLEYLARSQILLDCLTHCDVRPAWFDEHGRFLYLEDKT